MENNLIEVPSNKLPALINLNAQASGNAVLAESFVVDSSEMYEIASGTMRDIQSAIRLVEDERTKIAGPLHTAWKNTNALFKPITERLEGAKKQLGNKMIQFENVERIRVAAAERAALEARQKEIAEAEAAQAKVNAAFAEGAATGDDVVDAEVKVMIAESSMAVGFHEAPVSRGGNARRDRFVAEVVSLPLLLRFLADKLESGDVVFDNTVELKLGQLNQFGNSTSGKVSVPGIKWNVDSKLIAR